MLENGGERGDTWIIPGFEGPGGAGTANWSGAWRGVGGGADDGVHVVAGGKVVVPLGADDAEAGAMAEGAEGFGGEVVDVIGVSEAAPFGAGDVAIPAGVIGDFEDGDAVGGEDAADFFEDEARLVFVFEVSGHNDDAAGGIGEGAEGLEGVGVDAGAFDFAKFAGRVLGEFVGDFDADGFGLITGFDQFFAEPDDGSAGHASDIDDAAWFGGHELDDEVTDFLAFEEAAAELLGGFGNGGLDGCLGVSIGGDFLGGFFPGEVGFEFFVGWRVLQEDEAAVPAFHDLPRVDGIGLQGVKVLLFVADVAGAIGVCGRGDIDGDRGGGCGGA
jgi:hypothetical protein